MCNLQLFTSVLYTMLANCTYQILYLTSFCLLDAHYK